MGPHPDRAPATSPAGAPPLPIETQPWATRDNTTYLGASYQWIYRFTNGYGASVIQGPHSYGGPQGLYELGVIRFDCPSGVWAGGDSWGLTYETPITDDVLGHLSVEEVAAALVQIAMLEDQPACHQGADRA